MPKALGVRAASGRNVEGTVLSYALLDAPANRERPKPPMDTFPYLAAPDDCTGCRDCVVQCSVGVLELFRNGQWVSRGRRDLTGAARRA